MYATGVSTPYRGSSLSAQSPKLERILVATDLAPDAGAVVRTAAILGRSVGARVHVICVLEALMYSPPEMRALAEADRDTHPEASKKLADAVGTIHTLGVQEVDGEIEFGIAMDVVLGHANSGRYDLVVTGTRGRGFFSSQLLARSTIPVLAVPVGQPPSSQAPSR
jgi:nucleotide-binding universal stress UspA family protein